jgi:hypothetical protein
MYTSADRSDSIGGDVSSSGDGSHHGRRGKWEQSESRQQARGSRSRSPTRSIDCLGASARSRDRSLSTSADQSDSDGGDVGSSSDGSHHGRRGEWEQSRQQARGSRSRSPTRSVDRLGTSARGRDRSLSNTRD